MVDQDNYSYPVSELLNHGPIETGATGEWFDYVGHYGLGEIDVPELITLASGADVDWQNPQQCDAPVHACRALGQLGDTAADIYLVKLLDNDEDDLLVETVLVTLSMLGPRSLKVLRQYFEWPETDHWSQARAADGFVVFAQQHPEYRDECAGLLSQALSDYPQHTPDLNGSLVYNLVRLQATEFATQIEQVFLSGRVEEGLTGTWPEVQAELGLANEADLLSAERLGADAQAGGTPSSKPIAVNRKAGRRQLSDIGLAGGYSIVKHLRSR